MTQHNNTVKTTPKDFFTWAGAMVALYWGIFAFIWLLFAYIDTAYRSAFNATFYDPYTGGASFHMAALVVVFPIFFMLMYFVRKDIAQDPSRRMIWVRRWAIVATLFLAGLAMAGDLVFLLQSFFSGADLTTPFLLKVAIVFMVGALAFMHFIADYWGYWDEHPRYALTVGGTLGVLVVGTVAAGFLIFGTPQEVRMKRLDTQKVQDLQSIQYQVIYHWQRKNALPNTLSELNDPLSGFAVPTDPQAAEGKAYTYEKHDDTTFKLCADFNDYSTYLPNASMRAIEPASFGYDANQWFHDKGEMCFVRKIDPSLYPPIDQNTPIMIEKRQAI